MHLPMISATASKLLRMWIAPKHCALTSKRQSNTGFCPVHRAEKQSREALLPGGFPQQSGGGDQLPPSPDEPGAASRFEEAERVLASAKRHLGDELHDQFSITLADMKPEYVAKEAGGFALPETK
jgi:hypothetical protein